MRRWMVAALVATVPFAPRVAVGQDSAIAIRGATVIPGPDAPAMRNATIVIRGGRIAVVGPSASVAIPRGARMIDGRGRFVMPGLIDTHFHLALRLGTPGRGRRLSPIGVTRSTSFESPRRRQRYYSGPLIARLLWRLDARV